MNLLYKYVRCIKGASSTQRSRIILCEAVKKLQHIFKTIQQNNSNADKMSYSQS